MKATVHGAAPRWRFIALSDYVRPPEPAGEKVRRSIWGLWDRLVGKDRTTDPAVPNLRGERAILMDLAAAPPDWQEAVAALDQSLQHWLRSGRNGNPLKLILNPPSSGVHQIVSRWAADNHWKVIKPPPARQLLTGDNDRLRELDASEEAPWLLPALEEWHLRHHNGLDPVRQLLDLLACRRQLTLVCCDSWAWAYLCGTVQADLVLPAPLVPAAFDRDCLTGWFRALTRLNGNGPVIIRQLQNGRCIMPAAEDEIEAAAQQPETADFLGRLAAYSRGIPGVAWELWRHSLSFAVLADEAEATEVKPTVWMSPWQEIELPGIPQRNQDRFAFVLHTLLLHNGVSAALLPELLPNLGPQVRRDLQQLHVAGLAGEENRVWRVTALGYPVARNFLASEGYLVDSI